MGKPEVMKAIKKHCHECCGDMPASDCNCNWCNLHKYRLGKDPDFVPMNLTPEQRAERAATLLAHRKNNSK